MNILIIVFLTGVFSLFSGVFGQGKWAKHIGIVGLLGALWASIEGENTFGEKYQNMFWIATLSEWFLVKMLLFISILVFLLGGFALYRHRNHQSEIYVLVLFSLCGAMVLVGSQNMTTLFLGIEILSIPLYVLAGSEKMNLRSVEASVKYFLMGAFMTGFLLFGIALVYGSSGSLDLVEIGKFSQIQGENPMFILGVFLILGGIAFKVAMAPFHLWSPDVYQGSPTWVTLFMATIVKIASFYAFFKLMNEAFLGSRTEWLIVLWGLVVISLVFGSLLGLVQSEVKKMLAYSSVVNVGYMALAFWGEKEVALENLNLYLLGYALASVGIFMGVIWVEKQKGETEFDAFRGLAKVQPFLAFTMMISLLSMAGIPFTIGFIGKVNLLVQASVEVFPLVILGVLASVVSIAYYLKLIMLIYFQNTEDEVFSLKLNWSYKFVGILVMVLIILVGIFGDSVLNLK